MQKVSSYLQSLVAGSASSAVESSASALPQRLAISAAQLRERFIQAIAHYDTLISTTVLLYGGPDTWDGTVPSQQPPPLKDEFSVFTEGRHPTSTPPSSIPAAQVHT